ncbi:MAG: flagellar basal body P-ring formation chaperone FlgA [Syntrophales bacterium]|nr:flagellar basal body P-ring formation chaperone FlgA [Syntrophales bacterium]
MVDERSIRQVVRQYIEGGIPWAKEDVHIEFLENAWARKLPVGEKVIIYVERIGSGEFIGNLSFNVTLETSKGMKKNIVVPVRVAVNRPVVVARESLGRNRILQAEDVEVKSKWVYHLNPKLVSSVDQVVGRVLVAPVAKGVEITQDVLKEPILVRKGKVVKLQLDRGSIQIDTVAICEEDGMRDAIVKVRNMSSNRIVYARVVGENHVVIDY